MKHGKHSPSSAYRWMRCPSSVNHTRPETTSSAAQQGQLAHSQAETILRGGECPEAMEYVQDYVDYIHAIKGEIRLLEYRCNFGFDEGTLDYGIIDDETCHVVDLKYGIGYVEVVRNYQLMLYAAGLWMEYGYLGITRFVLHIYQPRIGNIATWEISADDIRLFQMSAEMRTKEEGYHPSLEACRYCHHKGQCKALAEHMISEFDDFSQDKNIAWIIQNAAHITDWVKEVKDTTRERLNNGENVDGVKLVKGKNYTRWASPDNAPQVMKAISPKQAKDLGMDDMPEVISVQGKPVVALSCDKRPSIIEEMFDAYE